MKSKEIQALISIMADERQVDKEVVNDAMDSGLIAVVKKQFSHPVNIRVEPNEEDDYVAYRFWEVMDNDEFDLHENEFIEELAIPQEDEKAAGLEIGDTIEEELGPVNLDRVGAQIAKQAIFQKIRESERSLVIEEYSKHLNQVVSGQVKNILRGDVIVDLGDNAEAIIPSNELLVNETFRTGQRIRAYIYEINQEARGFQIFMSRTREGMVSELFRLEIPEIAEDLIDIMAVARAPGYRSKVAVRANDPRIDAKGSCIGMGGRRIQTISDELNGEKIDIVVWDEDVPTLVINAMSPAKILKINVDAGNKKMDVAVDEEFLAQAIGRNGQNVRLTSRLTGWSIKVMTEEELNEKSLLEFSQPISLFVKYLSVDEELARVLAEQGFMKLDDIVYAPAVDLQQIEGLDVNLVRVLQERAQEALLNLAFAADALPEELLNLDGMTENIALECQKIGLNTSEAIAEYSVDELVELLGEAVLDNDVAAKIITSAREPWFK